MNVAIVGCGLIGRKRAQAVVSLSGEPRLVACADVVLYDQSFGYAAAQSALDAAVVYYGSSPETAELARVTAPVLGHYAGDDARVNATVPPAEAEMKRLGKFYEANVYEGAGHGFLRQQEAREGANRAATEKSWPRTVAFWRERIE